MFTFGGIFMSVLSTQELQDWLVKSELDVGDFHLNPTGIFKSFVQRDWFHYKLMLPTKADIQMHIPSIIHGYESYKREVENENYDSLFSSILHKAILIEAFLYFYDDIPQEDRFTLFLVTHMRAEYGFDAIDEDFLYQLVEDRPRGFSLNLPTTHSNRDELVIYRGHGPNSLDIEESYNWTLNLDIAKWFASRFRFQANGTLYQAKIKTADVVAYISDLEEEEVIVLPSQLYDIVKL
ncbi:hypothetical protein DH09_14010 [Bacillaceae bacterium JMAK1]|nr:hypothetical protein DH09_14010 [Bacillaceae bacterium JMAK1]